MLATICIILGIIAFLVMVHPVIFFLLVVPLTIVVIINLIKWLKG